MQFKEVNAEESELLIYGEITKIGMFERAFAKDLEEELDSVSSMTFKEALENVDTDVLTVRINSMGGSVSEALTIYNLLMDFDGEVITKVDGFAASAAAVIFMAGDQRIVPNSALLMIHNAWGIGEGNAKEFRKMADDLEKITQPSVDIYVEKTKQTEALVKQLMDDETWLTSKEALELGFATQSIKDEVEMSYQQNALLSLVKENKELKQQVKQIIEEPIEKIEEVVAPEPVSKWDTIFKKQKEEK